MSTKIKTSRVYKPFVHHMPRFSWQKKTNLVGHQNNKKKNTLVFLLHSAIMWAFTRDTDHYVSTTPLSSFWCSSMSGMLNIFNIFNPCRCACLFSAWMQQSALFHDFFFLCVPVNLHALHCLCVYMCVHCHLSGAAVFTGQLCPAGHQITSIYYTDRLTQWTKIIPLHHSLSLSVCAIFYAPWFHSYLPIY